MFLNSTFLFVFLDQVRNVKNQENAKDNSETVQEKVSTLNDNECQKNARDEKDGSIGGDNQMNDKDKTDLLINESLQRSSVYALAMEICLSQESTESLSPRTLIFENCSSFSHYKIYWDLSSKVDQTLVPTVNGNSCDEVCMETTYSSPTILSQTQSGMLETIAENLADNTLEDSVPSLTEKQIIEDTTLPCSSNDQIQSVTERLTFENFTTLSKHQLDAFIVDYKSFLASAKLSCFPWDYAFFVSFSNNVTPDDPFYLPWHFLELKEKKYKFNIVDTYIPLLKPSGSSLPNFYPLFHCVLDCSEDPCAITQFTKVSLSGRRVINVLLELELVKTVLKSFRVNDEQM
jgi:hypothetical protein